MTQSRRYRRTGGFTLAEMLVVLIIIGIAATIVIPMVGNTSGMQVTSAARHISSTLMFAQTSAISAQQPFQVVFDADAESYEVRDADGNAVDDPVIAGRAYRVDYTSDSRLRNVRIETVNFDGGGKVWFDRLGTPLSGPDKDNLTDLNVGRVNIQAGDEIMTITVEPITGRININ